VEDNPDAATGIAKLLSACGFEVKVAHDAADRSDHRADGRGRVIGPEQSHVFPGRIVQADLVAELVLERPQGDTIRC
jgi:hypothetical protein